jgi:hypothetical protein
VSVAAFVASILAACTPADLGQDDGFAPEIHESCPSADACAELLSETTARLPGCSPNAIGRYPILGRPRGPPEGQQTSRTSAAGRACEGASRAARSMARVCDQQLARYGLRHQLSRSSRTLDASAHRECNQMMSGSIASRRASIRSSMGRNWSAPRGECACERPSRSSPTTSGFAISRAVFPLSARTPPRMLSPSAMRKFLLREWIP